MSLLFRMSELVGRPVVTVGGEDVAEIKDVVYAGEAGELAGFTLRKRGMLGGPLKTALAYGHVRGLGRDAVIVDHEDVFGDLDDLATSGGDGQEVIGARVVTDDGTTLGTVVDVVAEATEGRADVVGYEIEASEALRSQQQRVLVPLPDTLAVSGENLVVPASAADFVSNDLTGFGAAVDDFRSGLAGGHQ